MPSHKGIYFGGAVRLTFGTEQLDMGNGKTQNNFFFGPTLEETIGISIAKKIFMEAGMFQIKHFGSDLMPDDIGFNFGLSIGF